MSRIRSNRTVAHLPPYQPSSSCLLDLMGHPLTLRNANARLELLVSEPACLREPLGPFLGALSTCDRIIFHDATVSSLFSSLPGSLSSSPPDDSHMVVQFQVALPVFTLAHQLCSMLHSSVGLAYFSPVSLNANFVEHYSWHGQCCSNTCMVVLCLLEVIMFLF